jgi:transposase
LGLDKQKLHDWYKNHLSDFTTTRVQEQLHQHDIPLPPQEITKASKSIDVPILKPENIGEHMAVDEKYINGEFYTLLTNGKTGKIALMAATTKTSLLNRVISKFDGKLFNVKVLTRDLASNYEWFGRENFMNAAQVADKFHVIKHAFEALQDIRIYYRQKLLTQRREAYEAYKLKKKTTPGLVFEYPEIKLQNNETHRQLLARSQYLLYKKRNDFTPSQAQRAELLFKHYPDIERAYELICQFRAWYSADHIINNQLERPAKIEVLKKIGNKLDDWIKQATDADITEILNFKSLVERNRGCILNYFYTGATNAIAEGNNSIIQHFIQTNRGARNLDFFYFRLSQFLS